MCANPETWVDSEVSKRHCPRKTERRPPGLAQGVTFQR